VAYFEVLKSEAKNLSWLNYHIATLTAYAWQLENRKIKTNGL